MNIEKMKLSELRPAEYNPRVELKPGMEEYEKLKQSILEFGFVDPPIFNKRTGNLVGGHQRVTVAKDLGIGEIEVSIVDLPIEKEKALNIALNKISGQWDEDKLALLLNELDENELNISGFTDKEIQEVIDQYDMRLDLETEAIDDGFEFELPEKPKAALGDIYQLGRHRLMCGDSTNKAHIELLMDGEKADLLITDPPYNVNYEGKTEAALKIKNDNKTASEFYSFLFMILIGVLNTVLQAVTEALIANICIFRIFLASTRTISLKSMPKKMKK